MARFIYTNNASVILDSAVAPTDTTLTLPNGTGANFPNPGPDEMFALVFENRRLGLREIAFCTDRAGDILTLIRGREGTTALSWPTETLLAHRMTAASLQGFYDELDALLTTTDDRYVWQDGSKSMSGNLTIDTEIEPSIILHSQAQAASQDTWVIAAADTSLVFAPESIADVATKGGLVIYRNANGVTNARLIGGPDFSDQMSASEFDWLVTNGRGDYRYANLRLVDNEFEIDLKMIGQNQILGSGEAQNGPATPSFGFLLDANTGFYTTGVGTISVTSLGFERFRFEDDGTAKNTISVITYAEGNNLWGALPFKSELLDVDLASNSFTVPHNLGDYPQEIEIYLECVDPRGDPDFVIGDRVPVLGLESEDNEALVAYKFNNATITVHYRNPAAWGIVGSTGLWRNIYNGPLWKWRILAKKRNRVEKVEMPDDPVTKPQPIPVP